jgi:hypothetical protein
MQIHKVEVSKSEFEAIVNSIHRHWPRVSVCPYSNIDKWCNDCIASDAISIRNLNRATERLFS